SASPCSALVELFLGGWHEQVPAVGSGVLRADYMRALHCFIGVQSALKFPGIIAERLCKMRCSKHGERKAATGKRGRAVSSVTDEDHTPSMVCIHVHLVDGIKVEVRISFDGIADYGYEPLIV